VLPFAVTHPDYTRLEVHVLLEKFGLAAPYFICPNQFWKHKNQIVVLEAVCQLKNKGIDVTVAFTGKTEDYRNPGYYDGLKDYVEANKLRDRVRFLGFIDRLEQLQLMKYSLAIIQPSHFEGWSTVVEDAKAMNKALIVSNINVHREQLGGSSAFFFDPSNASDLSMLMERILEMQALAPLFENYNYDQNIREFGRNFLKIS
jgi:glycosyltransferase involved in cell wall biosynthesis